MGKPFKDTAVGQFLSKEAPQVLDAVGTIFPPAKLLSQLISGALPNPTPEQQAAIDQAMAAYENDLIAYSNESEDERTKRLQIDMTSDSWLSKNIRPMILIAAFVLFTILTFLNSVSWGLKTPDLYMTILQELLLMAISFYFVDRTINKAIINNKKP